ncbi:sensor histidine kinase [Iningainema tapete]|uniref:histidine kinase n=1 Tax=Iningainema tapete BLCC-T55 TaxID=2748662 RepID=A0A8J7C7H4_9CYAN|nr:ATP-binding protein [Iningainema tapete]MBD2775649.1 HAMP domain-containing protein [Iningainema tapete BLCC-T55]
MKISTKFIGSYAVFVGLIALILSGSTVLRNQAEQSARRKLEQASHAIEVALQSQVDLTNEINALKDYVLLQDQDLDLQMYQKKFLANLNKLERSYPHATEIEWIRRRHEFLIRLTKELTNPIPTYSETYLLDSQQDFRSINAFSRDIDFFLNELIGKARQQMLRTELELTQLHRISQIVSYGVVILVIVLFASQLFFIILPVIRSLKKLQIGAEAIGTGNLDYRLHLQTGDEIEQLSRVFNQMAVKLAESYGKLVDRSTELTKVNQNLEQEISDRQLAQAELQQALHSLQNTQAQLIQTEKMSSLGLLVAGVAHEINNPVNFIYANITHASKYAQELLDLLQMYQAEYPFPGEKIQSKIEDIDLDFLIEDLSKMLISMNIGASRIRDIVVSLRNFSRLDEADMKKVDIHEGIESTLLILQNRLKSRYNNPAIEVVKEYGNLPLVECYPGQLNQVFMNILNNAIDALEDGNKSWVMERGLPTIIINTYINSNSQVVVRIIDNGYGMTEQVKRKLFDPFFTTKPVGKGTGLGLSISYQIIVEKHAGVLRCESEVGKGTEFWIEIPLQQAVSSTMLQFIQP